MFPKKILIDCWSILRGDLKGCPNHAQLYIFSLDILVFQINLVKFIKSALLVTWMKNKFKTFPYECEKSLKNSSYQLFFCNGNDWQYVDSISSPLKTSNQVATYIMDYIFCTNVDIHIVQGPTEYYFCVRHLVYCYVVEYFK